MEIAIDPLATTPIYQQIRDRIVEAIAAGELQRGDALAPVRTLAASFGISPGTVVKAYDELRREGFVAANGKSGTFIARDVASDPVDSRFLDDWRQRLHTLLAEGRAQGLSEADLGHHLDLAQAAIVAQRSQEVAG